MFSSTLTLLCLFTTVFAERKLSDAWPEHIAHYLHTDTATLDAMASTDFETPAMALLDAAVRLNFPFRTKEELSSTHLVLDSIVHAVHSKDWRARLAKRRAQISASDAPSDAVCERALGTNSTKKVKVYIHGEWRHVYAGDELVRHWIAEGMLHSDRSPAWQPPLSSDEPTAANGYNPFARVVGKQVDSGYGPNARVVGKQVDSGYGPNARVVGKQVDSGYGPNARVVGKQVDGQKVSDLDAPYNPGQKVIGDKQAPYNPGQKVIGEPHVPYSGHQKVIGEQPAVPYTGHIKVIGEHPVPYSGHQKVIGEPPVPYSGHQKVIGEQAAVPYTGHNKVIGEETDVADSFASLPQIDAATGDKFDPATQTFSVDLRQFPTIESAWKNTLKKLNHYLYSEAFDDVLVYEDCLRARNLKND